MRRLLALLSGLAGALAAVRLVRRRARSGAAGGADQAAAPDPRAEALRRRLDEARAVVGEQDTFDAAEVPVDRAEPAPADAGELRARVHAEGRAAADAMRRAGGES